MLDEPTRAERQRRGLRLAYTEFINERTALREIQRMPGVGSDLDPEIARLTEWSERAVATGETLGFTATQITQRLDDTEITDTVAKRYEQVSSPQDGALLAGYRVLWRMQSGATQGYRWPQTFGGVKIDGNTVGSSNAMITSSTADLAMAAAGPRYSFSGPSSCTTSAANRPT